MPHAVTAPPTRHPRILVAEDVPGIALGLEDTLRFEGYEVDIVTSGATASQRALEESFDLILLDVMLPGATASRCAASYEARGCTSRSCFSRPGRRKAIFYAVYDPAPRALTWANAGHCPPFLLLGSGEVARLESFTPPVESSLVRLVSGLEDAASDVCRKVLDEVRSFAAGAPQADDLTVMAAHVHASRP